jgi:hypothetical protein
MSKMDYPDPDDKPWAKQDIVDRLQNTDPEAAAEIVKLRNQIKRLKEQKREWMSATRMKK